MRRVLVLLLFVFLIAPPSIQLRSHGQSDTPVSESKKSEARDRSAKQPKTTTEQEVTAETVTAANSLVASSGIVDWLGPLSPIAMSPFFGITCLSGMSLFGPEWMSDNQLIRSAGPLKNPWFFGIFLVLTIISSVPRFTKVSKPFAQAVDRLEAYAVIIILLIIKIGSSLEVPAEDPSPMIEMGLISMTADTLLIAAMVVNVLVVNSVKFFFEFLVWLTPVPFLDAVFEICNKTLCAALMAVYVISPTLATIINLCVLVFAAIVFRWISRQVLFYRTMILDPILAKPWSGYGKPHRPELIVFPSETIGPFKPKSRLRLTRDVESDGWLLSETRWRKRSCSHSLDARCNPEIHEGWVMNSVRIRNGDETLPLTFTRRFDSATLQELANQLSIRVSTPERETDEVTHEKVAHEFA